MGLPSTTMTKCLLEKLPCDIFLKIASLLDNYTILCLLRAVPALSQYAVLLTDHKLPPLFFAVPGLRRMLIDTPVTRKHFPEEVDKCGLFSSMTDLTPIMLIECCYVDTLKHLVEMHSPLFPKKYQLTTKFDETTFLFVREEMSKGRAHQNLIERLDEFTKCKFHFGAGLNFTNQGLKGQQIEFRSNAVGGQTHLPGPSYSKGLPELKISKTSVLKTLQLHNVSVIDHLEIPYVTHLALIYTDKEAPRPLVRGLSAPRVRRFIVHFYHKVPCFQDMENLATWKPTLLKTLKEAWDGNSKEKQVLMTRDAYRFFEFANIPALGLGQTSYDKCASYDPEGENKEMDMSFMRRFSIMNIMGIPADVIGNVPGLLREVIKLRWTINEDHGPMEYNFANMKSLTLVLPRPHSRVPIIYAEELTSLCVSVLAPFVDISELNKKCILEREFDTLAMYNSPRLVGSSLEGTSTLDNDNWRYIKPSESKNSKLSFIGFFMPMLSPDEELEGTSNKSLNWGNCARITLRPVIEVDQRAQSVHMSVGAIDLGSLYNRPNSGDLRPSMRRRLTKKTILIAPMFTRKDTNYKVFLSFSSFSELGELTFGHPELEIMTSPNIKSVEVIRNHFAHRKRDQTGHDDVVVLRKFHIPKRSTDDFQLRMEIIQQIWDGVLIRRRVAAGSTYEAVTVKREMGFFAQEGDEWWRYKDFQGIEENEQPLERVFPGKFSC